MPEGSAPQVTITVTKPTSAQGSLVFTTYVEEGTFSIENVSLYDEIVDVTKESAETEYKKDAAYGGPSAWPVYDPRVVSSIADLTSSHPSQLSTTSTRPSRT